MDDERYIITTVYDWAPAIERKTRQLSDALGLPYWPRKKKSIAKLFRESGATGMLVVSLIDLKWHDPKAPHEPFFFHPSMAQLRLKRMLDGKSDPLVEVAGVQLGDRVIDCTAGMAADSIVLSHAVGDTGQVIALESNRMLHVIVEEGLKTYESELAELNEAMRRVQLRWAEHTDYLSRLPSKSVDVIYFDPMFRNPLTASVAFEPMRRLTNDQPIAIEAIEEARRVAVKSVVLKEQRWSDEFARLGFTKPIRKDSKFTYGVMKL